MTAISSFTLSDNQLLKPRNYRLSHPSLLLSTLAITILSLALPIMTLQVYDRILPNVGTGTLPVLIIGVCVALFLETLLRLCRSYIIGRAGASYEHRISCDAMQKLLNADLSVRGHYGIGEHLHRMTSVRKLKDFHNGYSFIVFTELAMVPVFFVLLLYIAHILVVVPAVVLGAFIILSLMKGTKLKTALHEREIVDDKRFNFLIESLEGVHTLKSFALENFFRRQYESLEEDSTIKNYHVTEATSSTFNMGAVFSHIMVAGVIGFGAWFVLQGYLTTGALIATLLLSGRMMQPVQKALSLWVRYQDYTLAKAHMLEILQTPQQYRPDIIESDASHLSKGDLTIENIGFSFKNPDYKVFDTISLSIKKGEAILISGGQGSGKTTLLKLIAGIYNCDHGRISIDGKDVTEYTHEDLIAHVGYIRQDALIFRGTIRDNITGYGQIAEDMAKEIASLLDVDKDIAKLPGGFDTFLNGDSTDNISVGLQQRIAIVRVLALKPKIILFDNADRRLDKEGYTRIYSLLARLKKKVSMILISEDRNICELEDRHFVIENKNLKEAPLPFSKKNITPYKELRL